MAARRTRESSSQFTSVDEGQSRLGKVALIVGYLALTVALLVAHFSPADTYEVSVYAATPIPFWIALGYALFVAVIVAAYADSRRTSGMGLILGTGAVLTIAALPILRGYRHHGLEDSLTHLGWTRRMIAGELNPLSLIYPGSHLSSSMIASGTGVAPSHAMFLFVVATAATYFLFIPLTVRALVPERRAVVMATVAGWFLLPINNVSTTFDYHTYSMTTLLFPLVLFLLVKYLGERSGEGPLGNAGTSSGALLILAAVAVIFFHPQVALNMLIIFGAIALVQYVPHLLPGGKSFEDARSMLAPTVVTGAVFSVWTLRYDLFYSMLGRAVSAARMTITGREQPGGVVSHNSDSVLEAGASLLELFVKMFLVQTVFVALALGLILATFVNRRSRRTPRRGNRTEEVVSYFTYAGVALLPLFVVQFLGDISKFFFRHVGFGMVLITILGVLALYTIADRAEDLPGARTVFVAIAIVALVLSVTVMFQSPYILNRNKHVTDYNMNGHEVAIETVDEDLWSATIRNGPKRFEDAMNGSSLHMYPTVDNERLVNHNLTAYSPYSFTDGRPYYFFVSDNDYETEVVAYNEVRYSEEAFTGIGAEPGVSRIQTNGEFDLYFVATGDWGPQRQGENSSG
jgi:hypothetical protein